MKVNQTRRILALAWPIIISMLSYTAMDLADTLFVGWLGAAELAAVGLAATVLFMIQSFFMGSLQGVSIATSHAQGSRNLDKARRIAVVGLLMAIPFGLVVIAVGLLNDPIFALMGGELSVQRMAGDYFQIRALGVPFFLMMLAIVNYFQGMGATRTAMTFTLAANLLNVVLDPIFIFGFGPVPAYGVGGAAIATVLAQFVGMAMALTYFVRTHDVRAELDLSAALSILRLGLPVGIKMGLSTTGFTVFTALIARLGTAELAAHQVALRVVSVSFLPGHGIAQAAGILTGQRIGARELEIVQQVLIAGLKVAWTLMGVMGLVFYFFGAQIAGIFIDSPDVIVLAASLLVIAAMVQLFDATAMVLSQTLNGSGDTRFTTLATIATNWCVLLPSAYLFALVLDLGVIGAWGGFVAEMSVLAAILLWRFQSKGWHRHAHRQMKQAEGTT